MLEIISIVGIFILSYFLVLRNFKLFLYILIILSVLLHKELFSFYSWNLMPIRASMVALFLGGVTKLYFDFLKHKDLKRYISYLKDPFISLPIILWVIRGLSIFFSKNINASLSLYAFYTTIVALVLYTYLDLKSKPDQALHYIKFFIYTMFGLTLFGYFQLFYYETTGNIIGALWNIPNNIPRVGSTFWDVNHYGALLTATIPILGVLILIEKTWKSRILNSVMMLSMLGALFLTNSRSAWMMAFATFMTFVTLLFIRKVGMKGILYILLAFVLISIPLIREYSDRSSPFRAEIKQYFHYRMDSFDSHFMLLTGTYQIFEEYPWLGGGYGSFFEHFSSTEIAPTYFGRDPAALSTRVPAHTIWGEVISETGIFGLVTFVLFMAVIIGSFIYFSLTSNDMRKVLLSASMCGVYIGWLIAGVFYSYNSEFFWLIIVLYFSWLVSNLKESYNFNEIGEFFLRSKKFYPLLLGTISLILIFVGLGQNHLVPWDEAIYAKIAKNMVNSGNYIVMNWFPDKVWYEKPPLYMWFMSGFMNLLGFTSLAARLPSALLSFGTVFMLYLMGKKYFNRTVGFISSLALVTTFQYLYYSRSSMMDVSATFFITAGLFSYFNSKEKKQIPWIIISGVMIGLGVMIKGVVGLLPFPIIGLFELYLFIFERQKLNLKLIGKYLLLLIISCAVFLPWHFEMYRMFGQSFIDNYLGYHVWDRATQDIEDKGKPFFWYLIVLKVSMRLWFIALLGALPLALFKSIKKNKFVVFLIIWTLFTFVFFSSARSKLVWYITPIYPALVLLIGIFVENVLQFIMHRFKKLDTLIFKTTAILLITVSSLFYLFLNKELVYTGDLTGDVAILLEYKDKEKGVEQKLFVDRVETPLVLFYTDGPFEIIDFIPNEIHRVPNVSYDEDLVLLTKAGRYSDTVERYAYPPVIIKERGDWILWFMPSEYSHDNALLEEIDEEIKEYNSDISRGKDVSKYNIPALMESARILNERIELKSELR